MDTYWSSFFDDMTTDYETRGGEDVMLGSNKRGFFLTVLFSNDNRPLLILDSHRYFDVTKITSVHEENKRVGVKKNECLQLID